MEVLACFAQTVAVATVLSLSLVDVLYQVINLSYIKNKENSPGNSLLSKKHQQARISNYIYMYIYICLYIYVYIYI